jgi:hypothetical protein
MGSVIHIPEGERGRIRVFSLGMRPEQARFLREPGALAQVLGIDDIDLDHVEIFPLRDLEDLGLAGYLAEGCGIPADDIAPDREALDALEGHVLLLRSRAFQGAETRLTPASQIHPVATYAEPDPKWSAQKVTSDSARPQPRLSPRARRSKARRIGGTMTAVVVALLLILLFRVVT